MTGKLTRATDDNRVSELLGLPEEVDDQATLKARVNNGLPAASVENIWEVMYSYPAHKIVSERLSQGEGREAVPESCQKPHSLPLCASLCCC